MKFTPAAIAALQLPGGRAELITFDDDLPGLGLRIRAINIMVCGVGARDIFESKLGDEANYAGIPGL
jgi:hypothetical protein